MPREQHQEWPPRPGYWIRVGAAVIGIVVVLWLLLILQGVLLVLLASIVLALGMQPAIGWFEDRGWRRGFALGVIIVVLNLALVAGLLIVIPVAVNQIEELGAAIPEMRQELEAMGGLGERLADQLDPERWVMGQGDEVTRTIGAVTNTAFNVFTVLVLTPYFAYAFPGMKRWLLRLIRRGERPDALRLLNEASEKISGYIVGNLAVSVVAGTVSFLGFWALGLDYPLVLALWVALTDLIPILGAFVGAVPAVAVASRHGLGLAVAVAGFLLVYQLVENYLISPRIMRHAIDLSPAAVIVAIMIGGTLTGVTGALLALPLAAMIKVAVEQYLISSRLETIRSEAPGETRSRRSGRSRPLP